MTHDFSSTLIRCSSLGAIMTEPKLVADKAAGNLSQTAKTELIKTYIKEVYDREKDITTKQMTKGTDAEHIGVQMLGKHQGKKLEKNLFRLSNEFLTGHPDIIEGDNILRADFVWDTKLPWDLWTFLSNLTEPLDKGYFYQLQGYFSLSKAPRGAIAYVLVDTPQEIIDQEKYYLLKRMNVISEESPEYVESAAGLEINMIYPDIPLDQKILIFPVERDEEIIEKINKKVVKCREFLQEFSEKHKNFNNIKYLTV